MKIFISLFIIALSPILIMGQSTEFSMFDNLIGKTWRANGKWSNGGKFLQEIRFTSSLDGSIVISESSGFVDEEQTQYGIRSHGVRQWDKQSQSVRFWEFDVFGGLTEGIVYSEGKNIIYQYKYGDSKVTDMWEFVSDDTYNFKVGEYTDGKWVQTYLSTQFRDVTQLDVEDVYAIAKKSLLGKWASPAWDGQLYEIWTVDKYGNLIQSAEYTENEKVIFESTNKLEIVDNELILLSVIKGSNPKIFKATSWSHSGITFENSDYTNPNTVKYYFTSKDEFRRRISGIENNEASKYTFEFKRVE